MSTEVLRPRKKYASEKALRPAGPFRRYMLYTKKIDLSRGWLSF